MNTKLIVCVVAAMAAVGCATDAEQVRYENEIAALNEFRGRFCHEAAAAPPAEAAALARSYRGFRFECCAGDGGVVLARCVPVSPEAVPAHAYLCRLDDLSSYLQRVVPSLEDAKRLQWPIAKLPNGDNWFQP